MIDKYLTLHNLEVSDLPKLNLKQLVSVCKSLDNGNGDWDDVRKDEYKSILNTATEMLADYKSDII